MDSKIEVSVFWFRRDLRIQDNAALYHALKSGLPVVPFFILDHTILDKLEDGNDARVTFIRQALEELNTALCKYGSSLIVKHAAPEGAWRGLMEEFTVKKVYTNTNYEPYATARDESLQLVFKAKNIEFLTFKDQVIFEKGEILKPDGRPYTVFTPYKRKWLENLDPGFHFKSYPTEKYTKSFYPLENRRVPSLQEIGFEKSDIQLPDKTYRNVIEDYFNTRDLPGVDGTSRIGIHLRFGTLSIRQLAYYGYQATERTWLSELIWRDFYFMIMWHFPETCNQAFKKDYDRIQWRNNEEEFKAWCQGRTGYPIVDAGMRQLSQTGWMHNRVRMITASFLTKHLLIDWRLGEAWFARKLIDYEQASNVGGWQWAAGCGNDAAPYFRVFNPELQTKKFDPDLKYIRRWIPELDDPFSYPLPIVDHKFARERALKVFKSALRAAD